MVKPPSQSNAIKPVFLDISYFDEISQRLATSLQPSPFFYLSASSPLLPSAPTRVAAPSSHLLHLAKKPFFLPSIRLLLPFFPKIESPLSLPLLLLMPKTPNPLTSFSAKISPRQTLHIRPAASLPQKLFSKQTFPLAESSPVSSHLQIWTREPNRAVRLSFLLPFSFAPKVTAKNATPFSFSRSSQLLHSPLLDPSCAERRQQTPSSPPTIPAPAVLLDFSNTLAFDPISSFPGCFTIRSLLFPKKLHQLSSPT